MVSNHEMLGKMQERIAQVRQRVIDEEARVAELRRDGQAMEDASRLLREIKQTLRLIELRRDALVLPCRAAGERT
jgi:hypothetical protein